MSALSLLMSLCIVLGGCKPSAPVLTGRVSGSSMEPNFAGERAYFACRACGLESFFSPLPSSEEALYCPRCHAEVSVARQQMGELVCYESVPQEAPLKVGDVIVFDPTKASDGAGVFGLQIKRVAALPGQKLAIKGGDLWIDGNRQQANCGLFARRAVPVDSAAFTSGPQRNNDWIVYYPASLYPRHGANFERHSSWLLDESLWDIHESRELVRVDDFGIEFDFDEDADSSRDFDAEIKLQTGDRAIDIHMTRESPASVHVKFLLSQAGMQSSGSLKLKSPSNRKMMVVVVDGSLRIEMDDAEAAVGLPDAAHDLELTRTNDAPPESKFGFVKTNTLPTSNSKWVVAFKLNTAQTIGYRANLKRDLYYRGPRGELEYDLPAVNGYQVLGDHVAASVDSRQEYPKGIPRAAIVGRIGSVDCH